jgi:phosphatidylserine decarboxylase
MEEVRYIDRLTKKERVEEIYGKVFIEMLYGSSPLSRLLSSFLLPLFSKALWVSSLYGTLQKSRWSRWKIKPFIKTFRIDPSEFLDPPSSFSSFNDFFIRKLKPSCRPIVNGNDIATLPADGRYLVYPNIHRSEGFLIKGEKFSLERLLQNHPLAHKYEQASMVLARLCPTDYHRFHFPCNCIPEKPIPIRGSLFSVNPLALKKNIHILSTNKRVITLLHTKNFGPLLYIEIGATYVGTIHQTFIPNEPYAKGDEKGYFSFGGSSIILLFEPFRIEFDQDLLDTSHRKLEMRGLYGQSLGRALSPL